LLVLNKFLVVKKCGKKEVYMLVVGGGGGGEIREGWKDIIRSAQMVTISIFFRNTLLQRQEIS